MIRPPLGSTIRSSESARVDLPGVRKKIELFPQTE